MQHKTHPCKPASLHTKVLSLHNINEEIRLVDTVQEEGQKDTMNQNESQVPNSQTHSIINLQRKKSHQLKFNLF